MFNDLNWGGYIELQLWPSQKTFVDSNSVYTRGYEEILTTSGAWESYMETYDIAWVLVHANSHLANTLLNENGWKNLYQDDTAVILARP